MHPARRPRELLFHSPRGDLHTNPPRAWRPATTAALLVALVHASAAAQSPDTRIDSPILRGVAAAVELGDPHAEASFWQSIGRRGAPLVETSSDDATRRLVTFLWRGDGQRRDVAVITPYSLLDVELGRLQRLAGTRIWYRSYRMRSDAVMTYRFGPDDSLAPFSAERDLSRRMSSWLPDPLNSSDFIYRDGTRASVLRLGERTEAGEGAQPPREAVAEAVPRSDGLPDQPVRVFAPTRAFPGDGDEEPSLLVLMDGDAYMEMMGVGSLVDRLRDEGRVPPVVVVVVPRDRTRRSEQYGCDPGWSRFLARELVPWVEARYHTSRSPRRRVVGGFSLGGLAAACAALGHPDVFGNVLAQSGSFYRSLDTGEPEAVARSLVFRPRIAVRWALQIGLLETGDIPSRDPSMLTSSRHLRDVLTAKGYELQYREFFGGHEHVAWAAVLPAALAYLLTP